MNSWMVRVGLTGALLCPIWACGSSDAPKQTLADAATSDGSASDGTVADGAGTDAAGTDAAGSDVLTKDDASAEDATPTDAGGGSDAAVLDGSAETDAATSDAASGDAGADGANADANSGTDGGGTAWTLPSCTTPTGAPGVAFGPNNAASLQISTASVIPGKTYTMGLAAAGAPGILYAEHAGTVYQSTDSGCSWAGIGNTPSTPMRMVGGHGKQVFAFYDNGKDLVRIDDKKISLLKSPEANIIGLGVHPTKPGVMRLGGTLGQLWQTDNGGLWTKVGKAAATKGVGYRVAFSPLNLDRAMYGAMVEGLKLTTDGGKTWTVSSFNDASTPYKINGMNVAFSPVEENTVWAMAIDISEGIANPSKTSGKYLWRSTDGGTTFSKAVAHLQTNDVTLTNGVHLRPDPTDANIVRWAFGTCISNYGTNLYTYNHGAVGKKLTWVNHKVPSIVEIVHHPASPKLLMLGLRAENGPVCK
ncbi:MAG: hypothetical protein KC502_18045 [Myxococcales bacterium]|nr:hypothetical protein [Myxococcales bacterium]